MHTHRYEKQVPRHHVQIDVKFLTLKRKKGASVRRYQYTAIDDATRVRALKIYRLTCPVSSDQESVQNCLSSTRV